MPPRLNKGFFTKVKVARELLRDQADEILKQYLDIVQKAKDAGDYESAYKAMQWLIEHMPSEDDGTRVVDISVDKPAPVVQGPVGPAIQIGISVGGIGKQLPPPEPEPEIMLELPPAPEPLPAIEAVVVAPEPVVEPVVELKPEPKVKNERASRKPASPILRNKPAKSVRSRVGKQSDKSNPSKTKSS
jgi:hypothetical protein